MNVMVSLMSVMKPPPALYNLMYFGCVCFSVEFGFLNCDDICMCVVNKQFEQMSSSDLGMILYKYLVTLLLYIGRYMLLLIYNIHISGFPGNPG